MHEEITGYFSLDTCNSRSGSLSDRLRLRFLISVRNQSNSLVSVLFESLFIPWITSAARWIRLKINSRIPLTL
jgi:hypothetical protein